MERDRDDALAEGEETVREGNLVIEERMNRREGLVEYEGTVDAGGATSGGRTSGQGAVEDAGMVDNAGASGGGVLGGGMQAGATVLGGASERVEETVTVSERVVTGGEASGRTTASAAPRTGDELSMSTDNTASGTMSSDTVEAGPIAQVSEGMRVIDANGDDVGKVVAVRMGDPAAVTTVGEEDRGSESILNDVGDIFGGAGDPDLPETFRNELVRVGYIRIDAKGWFNRDRYAAADQIAGVSGDTVRLSIDKDALPE